MNQILNRKIYTLFYPKTNLPQDSYRFCMNRKPDQGMILQLLYLHYDCLYYNFCLYFESKIKKTRISIGGDYQNKITESQLLVEVLHC